MFDSVKPALTRAAGIASFPLLLAVGMMVGGLIASSSDVVTAQDDPDPPTDSEFECEGDACVKIERRFWWDFHGCADANNANNGCNELTGDEAEAEGAPCRNYTCPTES